MDNIISAEKAEKIANVIEAVIDLHEGDFHKVLDKYIIVKDEYVKEFIIYVLHSLYTKEDGNNI